MLAEVFAGVTDAIAVACQDVYGDRLQGVVVFGSVARDRMRPDSDLDLLVVAEPLPRGRLARMDEFDDVDARVAPALTKARRLGATTRVSPIVRTFDELGQGGFLIFDIACDGRVVFDPQGAVTNYLAQVRDRLERRGAKRQTASGERYWVLEPNVRPGDIVVL